MTDRDARRARLEEYAAGLASNGKALNAASGGTMGQRDLALAGWLRAELADAAKDRAELDRLRAYYEPQNAPPEQFGGQPMVQSNPGELLMAENDRLRDVARDLRREASERSKDLEEARELLRELRPYVDLATTGRVAMGDDVDAFLKRTESA